MVQNSAGVVSMKRKGALIAMMKKRKRKAKRQDLAKRAVTGREPQLRFSPTAWAKLRYLRDYGDTEIGGFGIAASGNLLFIEEVQLVRQHCSWANVAFDDASVADFFDQQVDAGRRPEQFARVWVHTHPGDCPRPSATDEATFERVFGNSDWAVMFILARGGHSYARIRFNVGPGGSLEIPVGVDYLRPFIGCDRATWEREYSLNVQPLVYAHILDEGTGRVPIAPLEAMSTEEWYESWLEYAADEETIGGTSHERLKFS